MIAYSPLNGDPLTKSIEYRPRCCFIMTKIGEEIPIEIIQIREIIQEVLTEFDYQTIDASSEITGRDYLEKIWKMILSVPLGIGIISENLSTKTIANIFYEVGLFHAYGKESIIIKTKSAEVPSDFVRTEYIEFNQNFKQRLENYLTNYLQFADGYELYADQFDRNPLLSIDYLKRAYLITGDDSLQQKSDDIKNTLEGLEKRAKNSVELLMSNF